MPFELLQLIVARSKTHFAPPPRSALVVAAASGADIVCSKLLQAKADVTLQDDTGRSALMCAAANGKEAPCTILLQASVCLCMSFKCLIVDICAYVLLRVCSRITSRLFFAVCVLVLVQAYLLVQVPIV